MLATSLFITPTEAQPLSAEPIITPAKIVDPPDAKHQDRWTKVAPTQYYADPFPSINGDIENARGDCPVDGLVYLTNEDYPDVSYAVVGSYVGYYDFPGIGSSGTYYTIRIEKEDDLLGNTSNGNTVTTLDLVKLGRHLLNIELLDDPYKRIAADIDKSGDITIFDLLELRKAILHLSNSFPNNTTWRFVPADYVFPNAPDPFGEVFPETKTFLFDSYAWIDFIGIKMGDVNSSYRYDPNNLTVAPVRNTKGALVLKAKDAFVKKGDRYELSLSAQDFNEITGYQFTLDFDPDLIEVQGIATGDLADLSADNFGMHLCDEGAITTSWNAMQKTALAHNEEIFSLQFTAKEDLQLSEVFRINSRYTSAEAYNQALELIEVNLQFESPTSTTGFSLSQNVPNPFKEETFIQFTLPKRGEAQLSIYDLSGKVLHQQKNIFPEGQHKIKIDRTMLKAKGVLYYELTTPDFSASKKMLIVD